MPATVIDMTGTFAAALRAVNCSLKTKAGWRRDILPPPTDPAAVAGPGATARLARRQRPFDDGFDDVSAGFDDVRYASVAVNPLIRNKTHSRRK
jgi:hypothetical protein